VRSSFIVTVAASAPNGGTPDVTQAQVAVYEDMEDRLAAGRKFVQYIREVMLKHDTAGMTLRDRRILVPDADAMVYLRLIIALGLGLVELGTSKRNIYSLYRDNIMALTLTPEDDGDAVPGESLYGYAIQIIGVEGEEATDAV